MIFYCYLAHRYDTLDVFQLKWKKIECVNLWQQNKNLQDCKLRLNIAEATSFISFDTTIASPLNDHVMLLLK